MKSLSRFRSKAEEVAIKIEDSNILKIAEEIAVSYTHLTLPTNREV